MSRGLLKLSNAANRTQAKRDFFNLANEAINAGQVALVKKHFYPEGAGWRTVDKHLVRLRKALEVTPNDDNNN